MHVVHHPAKLATGNAASRGFRRRKQFVDSNSTECDCQPSRCRGYLTMRTRESGHRDAPGKTSAMHRRFVAATILTGMLAGLAGMVLMLLLHFVQHLAFGYPYAPAGGPESFLEGVRASSPMRRFTVLSLCGVVAALGWGLLYRFGRPLVGVRQAVASDTPLPPLETKVHDVLQIVTVAMGSPLGREVAPRELGALLAERISRLLHLSAGDTRILAACGAGAGLAAVYNVPFAGALFTLEALLETFNLTVVIAAVTTAAIAAYVAWLGLGDEIIYSVPHLVVSFPVVTWAVLVGPIFGIAGYQFGRAATNAEQAPRYWGRLAWCLVVYPVIGVLAIPFPELLGNGKSITQLEFKGEIGSGLAAILLVLRVAITIGSLRAGAAGGLITPSLACGALLATVTGGWWNVVWPGTSPAEFAIIGASAFLAAVTRAPLVAIAMTVEFTHASPEFAIPLALAVAGSSSVSAWCKSTRRSLESSEQRIQATWK